MTSCNVVTGVTGDDAAVEDAQELELLSTDADRKQVRTRSRDFSGVHFSSSKKLTTAFLVVALKTQAKTAKLTTSTLQPRGALTTFPCKLASKFFSPPCGGAEAPNVPPDHAYEHVRACDWLGAGIIRHIFYLLL